MNPIVTKLLPHLTLAKEQLQDALRVLEGAELEVQIAKLGMGYFGSHAHAHQYVAHALAARLKLYDALDTLRIGCKLLVELPETPDLDQLSAEYTIVKDTLVGRHAPDEKTS